MIRSNAQAFEGYTKAAIKKKIDQEVWTILWYNTRNKLGLNNKKRIGWTPAAGKIIGLADCCGWKIMRSLFLIVIGFWHAAFLLNYSTGKTMTMIRTFWIPDKQV
jgi:superoxide dismutase